MFYWVLALLLAPVAVLAPVPARALFFPATNPRLTQASFARIRPGMRREEVEAILGPPGDYRTGPTRLRSHPSAAPHYGSGLAEMGWKGDEAEIRVWLERGGETIASEITPTELRPVAPIDRLLWRWNHWRESRR